MKRCPFISKLKRGKVLRGGSAPSLFYSPLRLTITWAYCYDPGWRGARGEVKTIKHMQTVPGNSDSETGGKVCYNQWSFVSYAGLEMGVQWKN